MAALAHDQSNASGQRDALPSPTAAPRKPRFGAPCNGCGLCCSVQPCEIAFSLSSATRHGKPCPALEWEDGRSWCGMVRHPTRYVDQPDNLAGEAARLGAEQYLDGYLGPLISDDLGGVGGRCDSGPHYGRDRHLGQTASEAIAAGPAEEYREVAL